MIAPVKPTLNVQEFILEMREIGAKYPPQESLIIQKEIYIEAITRIINRTPFKTGRAKGGWQPFVNTPRADLREVFDKTGSIAIARAIAFVERRNVPYQNWGIANSVPYIIFLEEGSSDQAPQGMVRLTLEELGILYTNG